MSISSAVDLTTTDSATGQQCGEGMRPVVATCLPSVRALRELTELWSPAKFAHCDNQRGLQQPMIIEILQKRRKRLIEYWAQEVLQLGKIVLMRIPAGIRPVDLRFVFPIDRDERNSGFDKSPCHQQTLTH